MLISPNKEANQNLYSSFYKIQDSLLSNNSLLLKRWLWPLLINTTFDTMGILYFFSFFSPDLWFSSLSSFLQRIWDINQGKHKHFVLNAQKYKKEEILVIFSYECWLIVSIDIPWMSNSVTVCHFTYSG